MQSVTGMLTLLQAVGFEPSEAAGAGGSSLYLTEVRSAVLQHAILSIEDIFTVRVVCSLIAPMSDASCVLARPRGRRNERANGANVNARRKRKRTSGVCNARLKTKHVKKM